jgi:hypothetical protein
MRVRLLGMGNLRRNLCSKNLAFPQLGEKTKEAPENCTIVFFYRLSRYRLFNCTIVVFRVRVWADRLL